VKILAVDPGSVRVGLAVSDETETLATPLDTLRAGSGLAAEVVRAARRCHAGLVIVGLPRRLDGSEGPEAREARQLAESVRTAGMPVEVWDERFTSRMAEHAIAGRRGKGGAERRRRVDQAAAAILLQSYLDRSKR